MEFHLYDSPVGKIAQSILLLAVNASRTGQAELISAAKTAQQVEIEQVSDLEISHLFVPGGFFGRRGRREQVKKN